MDFVSRGGGEGAAADITKRRRLVGWPAEKYTLKYISRETCVINALWIWSPNGVLTQYLAVSVTRDNCRNGCRVCPALWYNRVCGYVVPYDVNFYAWKNSFSSVVFSRIIIRRPTIGILVRWRPSETMHRSPAVWRGMGLWQKSIKSLKVIYSQKIFHWFRIFVYFSDPTILSDFINFFNNLA